MFFEGSERKEHEQEMARAGRLPPGQSLTLKWPVLHYGSVPRSINIVLLPMKRRVGLNDDALLC